jgi:hypothetical protein
LKKAALLIEEEKPCYNSKNHLIFKFRETCKKQSLDKKEEKKKMCKIIMRMKMITI